MIIETNYMPYESQIKPNRIQVSSKNLASCHKENYALKDGIPSLKAHRKFAESFAARYGYKVVEKETFSNQKCVFKCQEV